MDIQDKKITEVFFTKEELLAAAVEYANSKGAKLSLRDCKLYGIGEDYYNDSVPPPIHIRQIKS